MSETLETLFGSKAKVRLLRFFLLNSDDEFMVAEIMRKNMVPSVQTRKVIKELKKIHFIHEKVRKGKKYYKLDNQFHFYPELKNLIAKANIYPACRSLTRVRMIGDVKLLLVSGTFLNYPKSKVDMVLVANNVSRSKLKQAMNGLEAEIGKEVSYVLMNSDELKYRLDMLDRFLLDFLEGPHDEVINKMPGLKRLKSGLKKH